MRRIPSTIWQVFEQIRTTQILENHPAPRNRPPFCQSIDYVIDRTIPPLAIDINRLRNHCCTHVISGRSYCRFHHHAVFITQHHSTAQLIPAAAADTVLHDHFRPPYKNWIQKREPHKHVKMTTHFHTSFATKTLLQNNTLQQVEEYTPPEWPPLLPLGFKNSRNSLGFQRTRRRKEQPSPRPCQLQRLTLVANNYFAQHILSCLHPSQDKQQYKPSLGRQS